MMPPASRGGGLARAAGIQIVILMVVTLAGCASFGGRDADAPIGELRRAIVLEALGQIGRPYRHGGTTPDGFDCSGLAQYVYAQSGVSLPRSTREQHGAGKRIDLDQARPGDLLFYRISGKARVDHVAIYLGDGEALHAPASGKKVIVARVSDPWWSRRFVDAVSVLP